MIFLAHQSKTRRNTMKLLLPVSNRDHVQGSATAAVTIAEDADEEDSDRSPRQDAAESLQA
jgi:hypothetical protein